MMALLICPHPEIRYGNYKYILTYMFFLILVIINIFICSEPYHESLVNAAVECKMKNKLQNVHDLQANQRL